MNLKKLAIASAAILLAQQSFGQATIASNALTGTAPNALEWLGSNNAYNVVFKSSNVERMRILSTGNIGIGTTAPAAMLHLSNTGATPFQVERVNISQGNAMKLFFTSNPATGVTVGAGSAIFQFTNPNNASDILFMPTPTTHCMVMKQNGNIGIGTTNPTSALEIARSGGSTLRFYSNAWGDIESTTAMRPHFASGTDFTLYEGAVGSGTLRLKVNGTNGNVGIGTGSPLALLHVNGKTLIGDNSVTLPGNYNLYVQNGILTEKLRVAVVNSGTWADYVFEKDYELKSLKEVEEFINSNKHLPEVPSAKEVEKSGVDMVEMDATLLKKIEELTLYIIEQDKRIEQLEKKNK